jgi:hypothetical protein
MLIVIIGKTGRLGLVGLVIISQKHILVICSVETVQQFILLGLLNLAVFYIILLSYYGFVQPYMRPQQPCLPE